MVSTKIPHKRMENQIVSTKITRPRVGQDKNNSSKGWIGGELNGQHENKSPKDQESDSKHENNSTKGWTVQKLIRQRMENKMVGTKIARSGDGWHKNNSPKGWTGGELYGRH